MNRRGLQQLVRLGEDSSRQFKADVTNPDSLAAELVAFSSSRGGTILIGVADDGTLVGLSAQDVRRINQLIGNSVIRNPVLASFAAKGVLPYRGLGTGIRRALADWPAVDLIDAMGTALGRDRTTVMRNIRALKTLGLLRREGSRKTGRWVIGS